MLRDWLGFYGAALVSVARVYFPGVKWETPSLFARHAIQKI